MSCSATELLILLLHNSREQRIIGRTRFQKIVFLLEEQGINFDYEFRPYLYGPYSGGLNNDIDMLANLGQFEEEREELDFDGVLYDRYVYSLTEEGRQLAERIQRRCPEISGRLRELTSEIQDLSTGSLIITAKYIMRQKFSK